VQVRTLAATGLQMMQSPDRTAQALAQASAESLQGTGAQAVLLGGAGLAGMGERVRAITGLPVWDCVEAAQQCLQHTLASTARAAVV
jgi:Asp/Glu/hydantoin racemase